MEFETMTLVDVSAKLLELAPDLDSQDRMKIGLSVHRSIGTVHTYLRGEGSDLLAGKAILQEAQKISDKKGQPDPASKNA